MPLEPIRFVMGEEVFREVCEREGIRNFQYLTWDLRHAYANPLRRYHTWSHVTYMIDKLDYLLGEAKPSSAALLAAFYHDYICTPGYIDNESESSIQAAHLLFSNGADKDMVIEVATLIVATTHKVDCWGYREAEALCDADLWGLGDEPQQYDYYAQHVREEYVMVPDELWIPGRKDFLEGMLAKRRIYYGDGTLEREDKARENLTRELEALAPNGRINAPDADVEEFVEGL